MMAKLQQTLLEIEGNFEKYRISEALMGTYKGVWDDFALVSRND
jgi:valyl-tRNA synthetase